MPTLSWIDGLIILAYLGFTVAMGLLSRKSAGKSLESYFVASRKLPGWLVGTSMVATTFAADTPLAVSGIVARHGIAGNWFWWSLAFGHLLAAFVFARLWRRASIVTDAEIVELRYSGRGAVWLRSIRAFYFAIPINCIIMAWVIRAMGKITRVLFPWEQWLPASIYQPLADAWPAWIAIESPSEAISIVLAVLFAMFYAVLGGLHSVIRTDVAQFALAMVGSVALAIFAVNHVGGLDSLVAKLHSAYGAEQATGLLAYFPRGDAAWLPLEAFMIFVLVQWWAQKFADGGGIIVQRLSAARDEHQALIGASWFAFAHYALRPWPWILVGLVALVMYPLSAPGSGELAAMVGADREMAYPVLMGELLPAGLLGIMVAGMAAAFMSTIDTHVNWGASYMSRDFYQRWWRPEASEDQLVRAAKVSSVVIMVLALLVTTQIQSIEGAWKFITAMGSGIGLVSIARWVWWRVNAWSEIAGLTSAALVAIVIYGVWGTEFTKYHEVLLVVVCLSTGAIVAATLLAPPTAEDRLRSFVARVRPPGFWGAYAINAQDDAARLGWEMLSWGMAAIALFAMLFGLGEILLGATGLGWVLTLGGAGVWWAAMRVAMRSQKPRQA